ncbi:hypothetical protein THTE_1851 [Thermogutta terrifontis]|uniref:Uncharacterized protein n=1 Tax=Thermogutta terrifontis TaxID=1331910 RepID=A0A286RET4_9BACT|nr:hypothetical protein THTE_1851 [Thermogutta terrifontis]
MTALVRIEIAPRGDFEKFAFMSVTFVSNKRRKTFACQRH